MLRVVAGRAWSAGGAAARWGVADAAQVSALELGRTHLTIDVLVVLAITLGVSLVELVSPTAEVPVPAWASAAFVMPSLAAVSDGELIAEVSRRLRL